MPGFLFITAAQNESNDFGNNCLVGGRLTNGRIHALVNQPAAFS